MRWAAALVAPVALGCLDTPPRDLSEPDAARPPALAAAYRFEEPDPLADSSDNGTDARCAGDECPTWIADREGFGQAAQFDGVDDVVVADESGEGPFTIMSWLRMDADVAANAVCPFNRPYGVAGDNTYQLCLQVVTPGIATLHFYTTEEPRRLSVDVAMESATWHHAAIRWDGTQKMITWDGFDIAVGEGKTAFDASGLRLGSDIDGQIVVASFSGALDDLQIWDGALSEEGIAEAAGL